MTSSVLTKPDTLAVVIALVCWQIPLCDWSLPDYLDMLHFYLTIAFTPIDTAPSMAVSGHSAVVELTTSVQHLKRRLSQLDSELDLWAEAQCAKPRLGIKRSKSKRPREPISKFRKSVLQGPTSTKDSRFLRLICAWDSNCVTDNLLPGQFRRCARLFTGKIWAMFDAAIQPLQCTIADVIAQLALSDTDTGFHTYQANLGALYASFEVWQTEVSHWLALLWENSQTQHFTHDYTPFQDLLLDRLEQLLRMVDTLLPLDQCGSLYFPPTLPKVTVGSTFHTQPVILEDSTRQNPQVVDGTNNSNLIRGVFQFVMKCTPLMDSTCLPRFVSLIMRQLEYVVDHGLTTQTQPIYWACQKRVDPLSQYTALVKHNLEGRACAHWFELLNYATDQLLKINTPDQRSVLRRLSGNDALFN
ncbi:hypothetical protein IWQ61_001754 [Dispira simplex]|nr:hypothetical protein IWQ61_001754 [Dispira simplex]